MTSGELSCEESEALLPLVADGALDCDSDPALFAHLARCLTCQESLACHDLVALSLTPDALRPGLRLTRRRLPVAWALGSAAVLAVGGFLGFQYLQGFVARERVAASLAAAHFQSSPVGSETQVISLGGDDPRHPSYILMQDGHAILVHPQVDDTRGADTSLLHPVGLNRY
jgi:hypothetical protein